MPERDRPDAYEPQTDTERYAAAHAVRLQRRHDTAVRALDTLTLRERVLIEAAFSAGAKAALRPLAALVGAAAATVDASVIRAVKEPSIDARAMHPAFEPSRELVAIVRDAAHNEQLHEPDEGQPSTLTPEMPTENTSADVLIAEIKLGGEDYYWAVRSTCGVVKVWSTRDSCMIATNPDRARVIGKAFASAMEAAADATESASRGGPRKPNGADGAS